MPTDVLQIRLETDGQGKVKASLAGVERRLDSTGKTAGRAGKALSGTMAALRRYGPVAAAAAGGGLAVLISKQVQANAELLDFSDRLGASTESLSEYRFVAEQTGVSFQTLTTAWQRQTRRVAEAARGTGEAKDALAELGLNAEELRRLRPEDQFERIADSINQVGSQSDRVRLAMKLWDTEGVSLLQTIRGGTDEIARMREEARAFGLTVDKEAAEAAAEFDDNLGKLKGSASGLGISMANELLPSLNRITSAMTEAARDGGILKAVWIGLGGVASELFGSTSQGFERQAATTQTLGVRLEETKARLALTRNEIEAVSSALEALQENTGENSSAAKQYEEVLANKVARAVELQKEIDGLTESYKSLRAEEREQNERPSSTGGGGDGPTTPDSDPMADFRASVIEAQREVDTLAGKVYEVDRLFMRGEISEDVRDQWVERLTGRQAALEELGESGEHTFGRLESAVRGWGDAFTNTLADSIMEGKLKFSDLADSIIRDLLRIQIQKTITDAAFGSSGDDGYLTSFFSELFATNHTGGVAGYESGPRRRIAIPRYHAGGIAGDEVPSILKRGEGIFTQEQMKRLAPAGASGQPVTVNVITDSGSDNVETSERQRGDGTREIDVMIRRSVASDIQNGGMVGKAIQSRFGVRNAPRVSR